MHAAPVQEDRYGLPISTESDRAADLYRQGQESVLAHSVNPGSYFEQAIEVDEAFALAHAALAQVRLRDLAIPEARQHAGAAQTLSGHLTRREQQHVEAVADQTGGKGSQAIARMREHLVEFPRDALILNGTTTSLLFAGRQDEMVQVTEAAGSAYAEDDWFYLGQHAFALQEVRRFEEARRAALLSLDRYPLAAFTTHALAHVFYELGEFEEGNGFMPGWLSRYDPRGGMYLHLSWHLALFLLARGRYAEVFALYEATIRPTAQPGAFQLYDPVSLLRRTDAYSGATRPELWQELGDLSNARARVPGMIFADLHHGMALAATNQQEALEALLASFKLRGERGNTTVGEVALPLMQGMNGFARGDYEAAVRLIEPLEERIYLVGGSKAQREVFHDTLLEALLRTGRFEAAEQRLRERLDRRPTPRDFYRLGRTHAANGAGEPARTALARSFALWPDADEAAEEPLAARRLHERLAAR